MRQDSNIYKVCRLIRDIARSVVCPIALTAGAVELSCLAVHFSEAALPCARARLSNDASALFCARLDAGIEVGFNNTTSHGVKVIKRCVTTDAPARSDIAIARLSRVGGPDFAVRSGARWSWCRDIRGCCAGYSAGLGRGFDACSYRDSIERGSLNQRAGDNNAGVEVRCLCFDWDIHGNIRGKSLCDSFWRRSDGYSRRSRVDRRHLISLGSCRGHRCHWRYTGSLNGCGKAMGVVGSERVVDRARRLNEGGDRTGNVYSLYQSAGTSDYRCRGKCNGIEN